MIPYYSPNLEILTILKSIFVYKSDQKIIDFYKKYSGKKYILITNSCRTSLYLSYIAYKKNGEVITSPLTCKVAIAPILESKNKPHYIDINPNILNMDEDNISSSINKNTIAIQVIHFGGIACDIKKIYDIAKRHNLLMIEDCAQGFGAEHKGIKAGTVGDICCFSMIKNAHGIGGGILATNDKKIYETARRELSKYGSSSIVLTLYRTIRNILGTRREIGFYNYLYNSLLKGRGKKRNYKSIAKNINKPNFLDLKINYLQLNKTDKFNELRHVIGEEFTKKLQFLGLMKNYHFKDKRKNSYTKFYIHSENYSSKDDIGKLNQLGIEARHLEHKYNCYYQDKLASSEDLKYYHQIHDSLISLPLYEKMDDKIQNEIISALKRL